METVAGDGNWKLTFRREPDHIVLLRAVTCDSRAVLPGELLGLPVTVLGDHALAPNAAPVPGEELWVTCGHRGNWDNRALEDLTLPPAWRRWGTMPSTAAGKCTPCGSTTGWSGGAAAA